MKKVVFLVHSLDSGGIENYLYRFLQYKADSFSLIVIYCKSGIGGQLEDTYKTIKNIRIYKKKIDYVNPLHYFDFTKYLKKNNFDVLCDFTGNFAGIVLRCAYDAGVKTKVVFYRGSTDHFSKDIFRSVYNNVLNLLTYKYADYILSNSNAAFDYFFKPNKIDERFKVIYNGIDATKFNIGSRNLRRDFNIPNDAYVIGHTGRYNIAKNHKVIIEVAEKLIKKYSDIYIIMCGNGVKKNLDEVIKGLKIRNNIRLFENRSDIPFFLNTMDVFFFPSITEGQPNSLIEAMVLGIPYVASNIQPIKETVGTWENLLNPNDVEGFTKVLEQFYMQKKGRDLEQIKKTTFRFDYKTRFNEFFAVLND